jgi:alkylation response protein AidB-like acyl-CoA dehydrogenase
MNHHWTAEHDAFRQRLRDVLQRHLPTDWDERSHLDPSELYVADFARNFCPALAREGLLIPHWPKSAGGVGLDAFHHWILGEEMMAAGEPRAYQYMNVNWIGPAILKFGTPTQIDHHVSRITSGSVFWCQGFSEPNAGSDLAAMRTRAEKTADGWRINGCKIWTSGASVADYCFLLARTGEGKRSISAFLVPMNANGIRVKHIPGLCGERSFHEVFFTDVEVADDTLLGEAGSGWTVMKNVLHNERIGLPRYALAERGLEQAVQWLKTRGRFDDTAVRTSALRVKAACEAARQQALKIIDSRVKGEPPSALTNVARYSLVQADRRLGEFLGDFLHEVVVSGSDPVIAAAYRRTASSGIGAGTAEVQLNSIARQLLELPREPQAA